MRAAEVAALVRIRRVMGHLGDSNGHGYDVRGLPAVTLLLQAAGTVEQVAPELCGRAGRLAQPDALPAGSAPQARAIGRSPEQGRGL